MICVLLSHVMSVPACLATPIQLGPDTPGVSPTPAVSVITTSFEAWKFWTGVVAVTVPEK
jgi:hypothetical protein